MCYSGSNHSSWSSEGYWWLQARHKLDEVVDALAPGGSGDPFAALTTLERDGLVAVLRHGFPRAAVSQLWQFGPWIWGMFLNEANAGYFDDFYTKPGYIGHDEPKRVKRFLFDVTTTVRRVIQPRQSARTMAGMASAGAASDPVTGITLAEDLEDTTRYFGAKVEMLSGKAKGRVVPCTQTERGALFTSIESHADMFDGVEAGDQVRVSNREFVAWCHQFLHQLDLPEDDSELEHEWNGLTAWMLDGKPVYPQLPNLSAGAGGGHTGVFTGKVIHINTGADSMVWPNGAIGWTHKIEREQGEGRHERYRMWWIENSPHAEPSLLLPLVTAQKDGDKWNAQLVSYFGATCQALRDLVRWCEDGVAPAPGTTYEFTRDGGLVLPDTAAQRGGVQPVVTLTANGATRADVKAGDEVQLRGVATQPPGAGGIVWTEWDFEGTGRNPSRVPADRDTEVLEIEATHRFEQPGTYFVTLRAGGHRDGIKGTGLAVENLARARVVVS